MPASSRNRKKEVKTRQERWATDPDYKARIQATDSKYRRLLRSDKSTWAKPAVIKLKARAKKKALPFNITAEDLIVPEKCPVLGIPIILGAGKNSPNSPSVDRMIPERGYVKGNVSVISLRANILKRDCTDPEELALVAEYVRNCRSQIP